VSGRDQSSSEDAGREALGRLNPIVYAIMTRYPTAVQIMMGIDGLGCTGKGMRSGSERPISPTSGSGSTGQIPGWRLTISYAGR